MGHKRGKNMTVAVLDAIEHARQDGYDAGYTDGLADGPPSTAFVTVDRPPRQLVEQGQVRQAR